MLMHLIEPQPCAEMQFIGLPREKGGGRIYGGQIFAQALMAAARTVPAGRLVHSAHAYFLRAGDDSQPISLAVEADFEGRSFSNRRVVATQQGKVLLNLTASFTEQLSSRGGAAPMPEVALPEQVESLETYLARGGMEAIPDPSHIVRRMDAFEVRVANGPLSFGALPAGGPVKLWFRLREKAAVDQVLQRGLLAYSSDFTLLAAPLQDRGILWTMDTVHLATIDHAVWIHENVDVNDWMLYVSEAPWTGNDRGYCRGQFFSRSGVLIADVTQEGVVKLRDGSSS